MTIFGALAILLLLATAFSLINYHWTHFPSTIGLLLAGLLVSGGIITLHRFFPAFTLGDQISHALGKIDFSEFLMHGLLGFLLFAEALHVNLEDFLKKKAQIFSLAVVGTLLSTGMIGFGSFYLFGLVGTPVPLAYCLVFGALISPTDPIAVLGLMKSLKVSRELEIHVSGESLFNDGIGIVLYSLLVGLAVSQAHFSGAQIALTVLEIFFKEVLGGVALGLLAGFFVYRLMKRIDDANLEVLLSVALVTGIVFLAFRLGVSAPLACVVAGIIIGNHGRSFAMSERTKTSIDLVWSFADYLMNVLLFLLLGFELSTLTFQKAHALILIFVVPLVLFARFLSIVAPVFVLRFQKEFSWPTIKILTWGGLRGGISLALALSLPAFDQRNTVLNATYGVIIFSIVVQGLTVGPLIRRIAPKT